MFLKWFSLIRRWTLKKIKKISDPKKYFFRSENFEKTYFFDFFDFFIENRFFFWNYRISMKKSRFFRSDFFDRIFFKFISWSRRIILKKSGVDSDSLEVRKHEDRRILVSELRKSKIWSVYTSGAAEFSEWFILRISIEIW